jgi:hypothetical protein
MEPPRRLDRPRAHRLGRWLRGRRIDRNPLRRGSDRAETAVLGLLMAAFLAGAPFAAHAAGNWAYATSAREARAQQAAIHQVQATLLQAAPAGNPYQVPDVDARWLAADGRMHTGPIYAPSGMAAGSTVQVWINQAGQPTGPPLQHEEVVSRVQLATGCAIGGLAITLIVVGWLARWSLDRRRMAAWDADWMAHGPRWTSRR